jgi:class 3 adenylate cyclase
MPTFRRRFELNFASAIDNNDIFGDGVNIAARLAAKCSSCRNSRLN